jgi:hypothetical protein
MPKFDTVGLEEAKGKTAGRNPSARLEEYREYIQRLQPGEAGKLLPEDGESAIAVRRRLGAAAKAMGIQLTILRSGDHVYFWKESRRRRGRPRKVAA